MQSSGNSSLATTSASHSAGLTRKRYALTGRSTRIDPRVDAVRKDLADLRLADRVFAPHYAAPMPRTLATATGLRLAASCDSELLAELAPGDVFEVLELATETAWGVAPGKGLVGYIDASALNGALNGEAK